MPAKKKSNGKKRRSTRTPPIKFRCRWVCDSGHTIKKTGPYQKTYAAARKGADAHDKAEHGGVTTATIETSETP